MEHYAGAFPLWLAPCQARVLPVSEPWAGSARELAAQLAADGLRTEVHERETLSYRIRAAETQKVPYMAIVGEREAGAGTVAVRKRGAGRKQETMTRRAFAERLLEEAASGALGSRKPSGMP